MRPCCGRGLAGFTLTPREEQVFFLFSLLSACAARPLAYVLFYAAPTFLKLALATITFTRQTREVSNPTQSGFGDRSACPQPALVQKTEEEGGLEPFQVRRHLAHALFAAVRPISTVSSLAQR